ncbi:kinase-like protein, partial [Mycena sanguinolenta]
KLSEVSDRLPSSLFIVGVNGQDTHPSFGSGYGDIYLASYRRQRVALKRMRHFLRGSESHRIRLKFCREALVWKDLCHPHILPFLGIDRDSFPTFLCMVSPFMKHGTVLNYLKTHGHANVDKLLYEIAQGLEYLHSHRIVHGDLRGGNILITEDWNACLADFGLSIVSDVTASMSTTRAGSLYWMAPELLDPDRFGLTFGRTHATDVYAFGCVCFELYTGRPPFANLTEPAALLKILNGERSERMAGIPAMSNILWQHVKGFWAQDPTTRPSTQIVVQKMVWPPADPQSPQTLASSLPTTYHRPMRRRGPPDVKVLKENTKTTQDIDLELPINVLVVEGNAIDNVVAQMMLTGFLQKKKIKYQLANNGLEAVNKYKTEKFDFILMDLSMPIMDGIDATKEIRRLEKLNAVPGYHLVSSAIILAQTASSLQNDRVKMLAAGCNDYLTKPINLQWLNSKLMEWGSMKALQMWAKTPPLNSELQNPLSEVPLAGPLDAGLASVIPALAGLDIQDFLDSLPIEGKLGFPFR